MVEAVGIEPTSENLFAAVSPSAVCGQHSLAPRSTNKRWRLVASKMRPHRGICGAPLPLRLRPILCRGPHKVDGCLIKQQLKRYYYRLNLKLQVLKLPRTTTRCSRCKIPVETSMPPYIYWFLSLMARAMSRLADFSAALSRLSCSFLPRASAMDNLTKSPFK